MEEMPFLAKNCDTQSEECAGALSWWRINERPLHNPPHLCFTALVSSFKTSMQNVRLTAVPSGTNKKWMIPLLSKKQINIVLILDIEIHGSFGPGNHHKLF
jgi:hypothetical protein